MIRSGMIGAGLAAIATIAAAPSPRAADTPSDDEQQIVLDLRRYLLEYPNAEQEGLTGVKGLMPRKVVVDKTRSSLESALASIKRTVEQSASRR